MAVYSYLVLTKEGKEKKGTVNADNNQAAFTLLKSEGNTVISLNEAGALDKEIKLSIGGGGKAVKTRDLSVFCRQLVSMINAGVTMIDSLEMLAVATENKTMANTIIKVKESIQGGEPLSDSMAKFPKIFPSIMISMVAAGEASGKLDVAFARMAERFEKKARMDAMLKKASVYPAAVMLIALGVIILMLVKIIPSYTSMFNDMGTELPAMTKGAVALSDFIIQKWYFLLAIIIAVFIGIRMFKKTVNGQIFFGKLARKLPVFGNINIKNAASNYARTLSTLLYSGLSMVEAIEITSRTMGNYIYKEAMLRARDEVVKGVPLSEPIQDSRLFPPMVGYMTRIGEETGDIEGMLSKLADYYDEEVEMATQTVMAALEPFIIIVLAGIVGLLIAVVLGPMVSMYSALEKM